MIQRWLFWRDRFARAKCPLNWTRVPFLATGTFTDATPHRNEKLLSDRSPTEANSSEARTSNRQTEKIKPTQKGSTTERERIARMMAYRICECRSGAMRANIHCFVLLSLWTATVEWRQFNNHTNPFTPDNRKQSAHGPCRGDLSAHFSDVLQM